MLGLRLGLMLDGLIYRLKGENNQMPKNYMNYNQGMKFEDSRFVSILIKKHKISSLS